MYLKKKNTIYIFILLSKVIYIAITIILSSREIHSLSSTKKALWSEASWCTWRPLEDNDWIILLSNVLNQIKCPWQISISPKLKQSLNVLVYTLALNFYLHWIRSLTQWAVIWWLNEHTTNAYTHLFSVCDFKLKTMIIFAQINFTWKHLEIVCS